MGPRGFSLGPLNLFFCAINEINSELDGKVAISQGSENAGKALVVGSDGNVAPGEVSGGEVWEEVDLSNFPTDWTEDDVVKVYFKNVNVGNTPSSWSSAPGNPSLSITSTKDTDYIIINLRTGAKYRPIYIEGSFNWVVTLTVTFGNYGNWNSSNMATLGAIYACLFNGGGIGRNSLNINKSDPSAVINKLYRLKR